jgi:site-specific DNA recombinase
MGRLTLNVLLSFAQFEREVTGERIRDKIAASKKKGMWMGGNVPLGYDAEERTLAINPAEAETVRRIFALYRELGCVRRVKEEADRLGLRTKCRTTANGDERGGKPFTRGHIYTVLSNPIYTGQIAHKDQLYPGQHPALIDADSWAAVRDQVAGNASDHRRKAKAAEPSLLAGLLIDAQGERLTPSHAVKKGRRYRYYLSAALITEAATDRARLAARRPGDRGRRDQDPGRRTDQPGELGRAVWCGRDAQRPGSEIARSGGGSYGSNAQWLTGRTSKACSRARREDHRR